MPMNFGHAYGQQSQSFRCPRTDQGPRRRQGMAMMHGSTRAGEKAAKCASGLMLQLPGTASMPMISSPQTIIPNGCSRDWKNRSVFLKFLFPTRVLVTDRGVKRTVRLDTASRKGAFGRPRPGSCDSWIWQWSGCRAPHPSIYDSRCVPWHTFGAYRARPGLLWISYRIDSFAICSA